MFDPLVRGSDASQNPSGNGLGLINEIVSAHQGAIAVTSSAEAGTTFVVRLPHNQTLNS
jgi:K+-sensing histidine kinase KdpD